MPGVIGLAAMACAPRGHCPANCVLQHYAPVLIKLLCSRRPAGPSGSLGPLKKEEKRESQKMELGSGRFSRLPLRGGAPFQKIVIDRSWRVRPSPDETLEGPGIFSQEKEVKAAAAGDSACLFCPSTSTSAFNAPVRCSKLEWVGGGHH